MFAAGRRAFAKAAAARAVTVQPQAQPEAFRLAACLAARDQSWLQVVPCYFHTRPRAAAHHHSFALHQSWRLCSESMSLRVQGFAAFSTITAVATASGTADESEIDELRARVESDSFHAEPGEFDAAVRWLHSKGVFAADKLAGAALAAILQYDATRNSESSPPVKEFDGIIERAVRAHRVFRLSEARGGEACEREAQLPPATAHTFTRAEFPGYEDPATSVLCMVHDLSMLVQRIQQSGLCYMHAPAVVQYYAVWHARQRAQQSHHDGAAAGVDSEPQHGMLDLAWYVANRFTAKQLGDHIFRDEGGVSVEMLRSILLRGSRLRAMSAAEAMAGLQRHGAALVAGFHAHDDFFEVGVHKHHDVAPPDSDSFRGLHAMVLVGARVDASGRRFFLLQNWWPGKQFVEVSQEYLEACGAQLHFVETPQNAIARELHVHSPNVHYAETTVAMEKAERPPLEMATGMLLK